MSGPTGARSTLAAVPLLAVAALLGGCDGPYFVDDVDVDLDFAILERPEDLHLPYATGSRVSLYVRHTAEAADLSEWVVDSTRPEVLRILSQHATRDAVALHVEARAPGEVVLVVWRDAARRGVALRRSFTVRTPDEIRLYDHGHLLVDGGLDEAARDRVKVVAGGTATFLAEYFAGGRRLYGRHALRAEAGAGMLARVEETFLWEHRDWLQVTASTPGERTVDVRAGNHARRLAVTVVAPETITSLDLVGEDERDAAEGEWLTVLGRAWDDAGDLVFGAEFEWDVDGARAWGVGDLYRYEFRRDAPRTLRAHVGETATEATIRAGTGHVASSNNLPSCRATTGDLAAWPLGLAAALAVWRRRRAVA